MSQDIQNFVNNISAQLASAKIQLDSAVENWTNMDKPPADLEEALLHYEFFVKLALPPKDDEQRAILEGEIERLERLTKMIRHWLNFEPPVEVSHRRRLRLAKGE